MSFVTRRLSRGEMERAARVHRASFDDRLPWLAGLHSPEADRAYFERAVYDRAEVWGGFEDDDLLGFVAFNESHVEHLYVLPAFQGRGLGTRLLSLAQERCVQLDLWTFQSNAAARRFYERSGFLAVETTDGSRNDEKEPDVRYSWRRGAPFGRS